MSPQVPAADREHFSRVRASLTQDGFDLAMIGHDRLQLLAHAAVIATELADQGDWQVQKDDPTQLRRLLRLLHGTGHRRLRIVALFSSGALACEAQVAELGTRVARWYLDEAPSHLPDHAMLPAPSHHSTRSARRKRSPLSDEPKPVRTGFTLAASLMLALLFGPTLWPGTDEVARLFTQTLSLSPTNTSPASATSTLAGVPVFLQTEKKALDFERIETTGVADILDKAETTTDRLDKAEPPVTESGASN